MSKITDIYNLIITNKMSWGRENRPETLSQLKSGKYKNITCANAASIYLQEKGCLSSGEIVGHTTATGKAKETKEKAIVNYKALKNCDLVYVNALFKDMNSKYKKDGNVFIYDSDMGVYENNVIYSTNNTGTQTKEKVFHTSGYQFSHKILWVIIPKEVKIVKKIVDFYHNEDVSSFDTLVANTHFVILKASQGTTLDSKCKARIKEFEKRKHPYWLYVFLNKGNELKQTKFMVNSFKDVVGDYFIGWCIDIEKGNSCDSCIETLNWLKTQKKKCMVYVNHSSYDTYSKLINMKDDQVGIWECRYGKNDGTDTSDKYPFYKMSDLGQYTENGTCAGLKGTIDLNKITNFGKKLEWFITKTYTSSTTTTTTTQNAQKSVKKQIKITGKDGANVRTSANILASLCKLTSKLKYGETVEYTTTEKDSRGVIWYLIKKNNHYGWVSGNVSEVVK